MMDELSQKITTMKSSLLELKAEKEMLEMKKSILDQETFELKNCLHELELEIKSKQRELHHRTFISRQIIEIDGYSWETQEITKRWKNNLFDMADYCAKNLDSMVFCDPKLDDQARDIQELRDSFLTNILTHLNGSVDDMARINRMVEDLKYEINADATKDLTLEKDELHSFSRNLANNDELLRFSVTESELERPHFSFALPGIVINSSQKARKESERKVHREVDRELQKGENTKHRQRKQEKVVTSTPEIPQQAGPSGHVQFEGYRHHEQNSGPAKNPEKSAPDSQNKEFAESIVLSHQKRKRTVEVAEEITLGDDQPLDNLDNSSAPKKTKFEPMEPQSVYSQGQENSFFDADFMKNDLANIPIASQDDSMFLFTQPLPDTDFGEDFFGADVSNEQDDIKGVFG